MEQQVDRCLVEGVGFLWQVQLGTVGEVESAWGR